MSSSPGRTLRGLLSSSSSFLPFPSLLAHGHVPHGSSSLVYSSVPFSRRAFAAVPSSSAPTIALPPPCPPPPAPVKIPPPPTGQDGKAYTPPASPPISLPSFSPQPPARSPPPTTSRSSALAAPPSYLSSPSSPTTPTHSKPSSFPRTSKVSDPSLQNRLSTISSQTSSSIRQAAAETSHHLWTRADHLATQAVSRFSMMGAKLNEITGYDRIEKLKSNVSERESDIANLRSALQQAKTAYLTSVSLRSSSQREVNDLLQRKSSWRTEDVERFTVLVRQDHENSRLEERGKAEMEGAEGKVESAFTELMNAILNRYHEEQLWSDKLRSFSTYVSLGVMVANLLVFVTAIVFVEPYKRKRLAQTFEERVAEMTAQVEERIEVGVGRVLEALKKKNGESGLVASLKRVAGKEGGPAAAAATVATLGSRDTTPPSPASYSTPPQPSAPSPSPSLSTYSSVLPSSLLAALPTHLRTISVQTPRDLLEGAKFAAESSKTFVVHGWEKEGRERDLLVVAGGGAVVGGGLIWALFR